MQLAYDSVKLDWRVMCRALSRSTGEAGFLLATAAVVLSTLGDSAARLGEAITAGHVARTSAVAAVGVYVWSTFVAAFAVTLSAGALPFAQRLLGDLDLRPISRTQSFFVLQAVSVFGRTALVPLTVGLPLLLLFGAWLDGAGLAAAIAAMALMVRLSLPILVIVTRLLRSPRIAAAVGAATVAVVAVALAIAPGELMRVLPPVLMMQIALEGPSTWTAWAGLGAWTVVLGALESWSMPLERVELAARRAEGRLSAMPRPISIVAGSLGLSPNLLHVELLRLMRSRHFMFGWIAVAAILPLLARRLRGDGDLVPLVMITLAPVLFMANPLRNAFGADRTGFQSFLLLPINIRDVLRSKVLAVALFAGLAEVLLFGILLMRGDVAWSPVIPALWVMALGYLMWSAAFGLVASVLFPAPLDPRRAGNSTLAPPATIVVVMGNALYFAGAFGLAYFADSAHWPAAGIVAAALALAAVSSAAAVTALPIAARLLSSRREEIAFALNADQGVRS